MFQYETMLQNENKKFNSERKTNRKENQKQTKTSVRSSHRGAVEMNPTRNHEVGGSIPGLTQWAMDPALP